MACLVSWLKTHVALFLQLFFEKSREIEDLKHSNELLNESVNDLNLKLDVEKNTNSSLDNELKLSVV